MKLSITQSESKFTLLFIISIISLGCQPSQSATNTEKKTSIEEEVRQEKELLNPSHPLVDSARNQIGVVVIYDGKPFQGGYPPNDRGVCTDVIDRAMRANGYQLKDAIDTDFKKNPGRYPGPFAGDLNFRRVRNLRIFFNNHAKKLSTCTADSCFKQGVWKAGDIVTYEQMSGGLWHIAIISNKYELNENGVKIPYIIHNAGSGTQEEFSLLTWPTPINGHFRVNKLLRLNQ
jgi:uncharacterized protein YijF (DUF1287 family)